MRPISALGWLLLLVFLSACANSAQQSRTSTPQAVSTAYTLPTGTAETVAHTVQGASATPDSPDYRLGPLDVIEVSVFEVPELTKTVQINAGGLISLPLIGKVRAVGRTIDELEREIEDRLGQQYLQSPEVSILVKDYTSQRVTIEGSVNSPGIYSISGRTTLLQVIALAKGFDRVADESGVIIFRTIDGTRKAAVFDIGPIRSGDAEDPVVLGGDVVVVDQSAVRTAWRGLRESLGVMGFFRPFVF